MWVLFLGPFLKKSNISCLTKGWFKIELHDLNDLINWFKKILVDNVIS